MKSFLLGTHFFFFVWVTANLILHNVVAQTVRGLPLVIDRWGDSMFHVENISPELATASWDGRVKNDLAEQGVYVYIMKLRFANGEEELRTGDVTLLRAK